MTGLGMQHDIRGLSRRAYASLLWGESLQGGCGERPDSSLFSRPAEALFETLGHVEGDEAGEVIRIVFADLDDLFD